MQTCSTSIIAVDLSPILPEVLTLHPIWMMALILILCAVIILGYTAWMVRRKRRNLEYISIPERRRLQSLMVLGMTLLLVTFIGIGTVLLG
jgi:ABC-type phosphate transport system permease subunit